MPGHTSSPYWTAVDFDSEEDERSAPNNRMYLDPWDNDAFSRMNEESIDSSQDQFNSIAGEPVSASFYYVPTKNYDSSEEKLPPPKRIIPEEVITPDHSIYNRKTSRSMIPDHHDIPIYAHRPVGERRRSMYMGEPMYAPHPMIYESIYGPMPIPPPGYVPLQRPRVSITHHPDYVPVNSYNKNRRQSRMADAYEHYMYESLPQDYEDWAHPMPKAAPTNFHLSRYGHLQIDYSCSWNSLDRLIRNH
ncbi:unnamed protein product [Colias eurytheme]|nr:unnamed protein product [Colias eurytheme]